MHRERRAFLDAIAAQPADDLPSLVYADWLDEHCDDGQPGWPRTEAGSSAQAELIRVQCDAAFGRAGREHPLRVRSDELSRLLVGSWFRPDLAAVLTAEAGLAVFHRGLLACDLYPLPGARFPERWESWYRTLGPCGDLTADGLVVADDLYLAALPITRLPDGLTVFDRLSTWSPNLCSLPEDLTVLGDLAIRGTAVRHLPEGIRVGGAIRLDSNHFLVEGRRGPGWPRDEAERWVTHPGLSPRAKRSALTSAGYPDLADLIPPDPAADRVGANRMGPVTVIPRR